ncbi:3'-5' exonuclease [Xanthobacter autotrophicus]|uniref:3'-5' exonuclease n=1 Tax=Xanthobacter autotrophicus TaxID=280 RepID=UPI00372CB611
MAQDTCAVTHVMVDLETLGTKPGCSIASIGAVIFDPASGSIGKTFFSRISLQSCDEAGLKMDAKTVYWWMQQSEEARRNTFLGQRVTLNNAIHSFSGWWFENNLGVGTRMWAHGATFDPGILEAAYAAIGKPIPWEFWMSRDTRTIFDLAGIDLSDFRGMSAAHSALDDAETQALAVIASYAKLGIRGGANVE